MNFVEDKRIMDQEKAELLEYEAKSHDEDTHKTIKAVHNCLKKCRSRSKNIFQKEKDTPEDELAYLSLTNQ